MSISSIITKTPLRAALTLFVATALIVFLITAFWPQVSSFIFPNTTLGLYDKSFWENVLVEAHGLVFDIFVLGLIFVWMDTYRQKRESIDRDLENLCDFNTLTDNIYLKKKVNIIKRLNKNKIYKIDVTDLIINKKTRIKDISFEHSNLFGLKIMDCQVFNLKIKNSKLNSADFSKSVIRNSEITGSYLKNVSFKSATLVGLNFMNSDLVRAKFDSANLQSADLRGCNLERTTFTNANLKNANLKECSNLNYNALLGAKCIDYLKADKSIIEELKKRKPEMKIS
ncbi:hypothetical protein PA25_04440 [Pseudoalteromonas sp. A25]|uniref:pentapeptide repeat-containing protein n=1 Tax=Pseudoalteromonas sp. A25 TaxID=116092 RepID=UPI0012612B24|nr:pentapeptide repeat-containing protein [Pseudoalteromonas sp. A25]BBN80459.1 hypothetical protein PA25_04440 [Pseudoalteromonas sp. A25]